MRERIERTWESGGWIAWLLSPLALLYALGWSFYLLVYKLGLKKPKEFRIKIVCIGNLVAGGAGKTPMTIAVYDMLTEAGFKVVVGTSGYGSVRAENASLAPEGQLDVTQWGDESTMLRWLRPEMRIVVGRNRVMAAALVEEHFGRDCVLLMDDGFQHLPLKKTVSVVLDIDGSNRFCFPAGPYREPRFIGFPRADKVLIRGRDYVSRAVVLKEPDGTIRTNVTEADALCAIGNPERFIRSLQSGGVTVREKKFLTDHDPLTRVDLFDGIGEDKPLVVTAKDFMKLRIRPDLEGLDLIVADYGVRIDRREEFCKWLTGKLNEFKA